jgi:hypothetical protein
VARRPPRATWLRWLSAALRGLVIALALLITAWWTVALGLRVSGPGWLAEGLAALYAVASAVVLFALRPFWRALAVWVIGVLLLLLWWSTIRPSNDRDWVPDVDHLATAEVHGDTLIVHNVRNFDYRSETDYTPRWETRTYDLNGVRGLDLFLSHWGAPGIAHTIMSWEFADGQHLAISIETRRERGEEYSALRGFFRQYELYYVVADERDVIRLRTNYRGEDVYLYRLQVDPAVARALLLDYVATLNRLAEQPEFYNALIDNCTTGIRVHARSIGAAQPFDYRILANGSIDEMLYERGRIDNSRPFAEVRAASAISARARAAGDDPDFSRRIREPANPPQP